MSRVEARLSQNQGKKFASQGCFILYMPIQTVKQLFVFGREELAVLLQQKQPDTQKQERQRGGLVTSGTTWFSEWHFAGRGKVLVMPGGA